MQHCVVCTGEMTKGFVDEGTGNTWCDEVCLRVDYTAQEQKAAYNEDGGGLYWTEWEVEESSVGTSVLAEQLELEIGSVNA